MLEDVAADNKLVKLKGGLLYLIFDLVNVPSTRRITALNKRKYADSHKV